MRSLVPVIALAALTAVAGSAALGACAGAQHDDDACSALQVPGRRFGIQSPQAPSPIEPDADTKPVSGSGQQSDYPDWVACSYADSGNDQLCGYKVKFTSGSAVQYRWMYPNASFGEVDGTAIYLQEQGIDFSTRVTIDDDGVVIASEQWDFFPVPDLEPLKGWHLEGMPQGTYNVNACPITYGDASCSPARTLPPARNGSKLKMIIDSDIGVFMDDPFAIACAAVYDQVDLEMVITTSRNTSASAYIAAKLLWTAGRPDVEVNAGYSQLPDDEQLMTPWSQQPPSGSGLSEAQWQSELSRMVKQPETNNIATPMRAKALIGNLRRTGAISPEQPLVYWIIGPADSQARVQSLLSAEEKACVFVIAMGGSIVDGFQHRRPVAARAAALNSEQGHSMSLAQNRLAFGPNSGMSPWPETNVKGDDGVIGAGTAVKDYNAMVQDPDWAAVLLSTSEPVCDSQPGIGNTALAWEQFKASKGPGATAVMSMMYAWVAASQEQCQSAEDAAKMKCAPAAEAGQIAAANYSHAPAQCDLMSLMPWVAPKRFGIESMYLDFTTGADEVRGCARQVQKPAGSKCISVATYYKPATRANPSRGEVTLEEGSQSRDVLINAFLKAIETGSSTVLG